MKPRIKPIPQIGDGEDWHVWIGDKHYIVRLSGCLIKVFGRWEALRGELIEFYPRISER